MGNEKHNKKQGTVVPLQLVNNFTAPQRPELSKYTHCSDLCTIRANSDGPQPSPRPQSILQVFNPPNRAREGPTNKRTGLSLRLTQSQQERERQTTDRSTSTNNRLQAEKKVMLRPKRKCNSSTTKQVDNNFLGRRQSFVTCNSPISM